MSILVGLTGENCAGKGTVADYLVKNKGFQYTSLSDAIRFELKKEGREITRNNLIEKGNELREAFGPGALGRKIVETLKKGENYVVDSIRNPSEVEELRKLQNFFLINVTAPVELRFKRSLSRNRDGDPKTFEAFVEVDKRESAGSAAKQNLIATAQMADEVVANGGELQELHKKVDVLIEKWVKELG